MTFWLYSVSTWSGSHIQLGFPPLPHKRTSLTGFGNLPGDHCFADAETTTVHRHNRDSKLKHLCRPSRILPRSVRDHNVKLLSSQPPCSASSSGVRSLSKQSQSILSTASTRVQGLQSVCRKLSQSMKKLELRTNPSEILKKWYFSQPWPGLDCLRLCLVQCQA